MLYKTVLYSLDNSNYLSVEKTVRIHHSETLDRDSFFVFNNVDNSLDYIYVSCYNKQMYVVTQTNSSYLIVQHFDLQRRTGSYYVALAQPVNTKAQFKEFLKNKKSKKLTVSNLKNVSVDTKENDIPMGIGYEFCNKSLPFQLGKILLEA